MSELEATVLVSINDREPRSMLVTNVPNPGERVGIKLQSGDDWQYGVCQTVERSKTGGPVYRVTRL